MAARRHLTWARTLGVLIALVGLFVIGARLIGSPNSNEWNQILCISTHDPWARVGLEVSKRILELSCAANFLNDQEAARELEELRHEIRGRLGPIQPGPPRVEPDTPWTSYLLVINGTEVEHFPFFLLIEGFQEPFEFQGELKTVHYVTVPREVDLQRPLEVHIYPFVAPGLSTGLHSFFLIFDATVSLSILDVLWSGPGAVYAGNGEPPRVAERPPDEEFIRGTPQEASVLPHGGIFLSTSPQPRSEEELLSWEVTMRPGELLSYYIHTRPFCEEGDPPRDYWVSVYLESRQIPLDVSSSRKKALVHLECQEEVTMFATLRVPQEPGRYRLYPLGIQNPYYTPGPPTPQPLWPSVFPPSFSPVYYIQVTE